MHLFSTITRQKGPAVDRSVPVEPNQGKAIKGF
jgi:hypothetical protein